jgi:hypothetical protein
MSHFVVMRAAERLVTEAEALHPNDRVKQCVYIIGRRGVWTDAYASAERDVAFDRVFRHMTDEETQIWAHYCLHQDVPAMARGRMWRATSAPMAQERAA